MSKDVETINLKNYGELVKYSAMVPGTIRIFTGAPGVGKTQKAYSVIAELNEERKNAAAKENKKNEGLALTAGKEFVPYIPREIVMIDERLYQRGDTGQGMPNISTDPDNGKDVAVWLTPEWFNHINKLLAADKEVVLLFDDLHKLVDYQMAQLYEFLEKQTICGNTLLRPISIVIIGNFDQDQTGGCLLDAPVMNRCHGYFKVIPEGKEIAMYFFNKYAETGNKWYNNVGMFLMAYKDHCYKENPEPMTLFPSPRAWERFIMNATHVPIDHIGASPNGVVGAFSGSSFVTAMRFLGKTDEELLTPEKRAEDLPLNIIKSLIYVSNQVEKYEKPGETKEEKEKRALGALHKIIDIYSKHGHDEVIILTLQSIVSKKQVSRKALTRDEKADKYIELLSEMLVDG